MRYVPPATPNDDWALLEIAKNGNRPCTDRFSAARDQEFALVYGKLRILKAAGHPPDPERGNPEIEKIGKYTAVDGASVTIYVLKAKPGPWRLYYFPKPNDKQFILLFSTSKKKNLRDRKDVKRACNLIDALARREYQAVRVDLPDP